MAARNDGPVQAKKKFSAMDFSEKLAFFGKVIVFLASGGFAYPTIFSPD